MPSRRTIILFGFALLLALVAMVPLRLIFAAVRPADLALSARAVTGSVWRGQLKGAAVAGLPLGDLNAGLSPFALLKGRASFALSSQNDPTARAILIATASRIGVDHATLKVKSRGAFSPLPIEGLDLSDVRFRLKAGRCAEASGQVRVDIADMIAGIRLDQGMVGTLRCDGDALGVTLVSQTAMERIIVRITPQQGYRATIIVAAGSADRAQQLSASGFRETAQGFVMQISGSF
jgi:general secretion pathway protein N